MALSPQFICGVAKRRQHQPPKASEPGGKGKRLLSFKESLALRKNYGAANIGNITKPYRLIKKKIKKSLFFILYVLSFYTQTGKLALCPNRNRVLRDQSRTGKAQVHTSGLAEIEQGSD